VNNKIFDSIFTLAATWRQHNDSIATFMSKYVTQQERCAPTTLA